MTFAEAKAHGNKVGWSHVAEGSDSFQTITAEALALRHCLQPKIVYDWAKQTGTNLFDKHIYCREAGDWEFIEAVLNGTPLPNEAKEPA